MCLKTIRSRHTARGIKYEPVAIDKYHKYMLSQKTPVRIFKSGILGCSNSPILGCSQDAKVIRSPIVKIPLDYFKSSAPKQNFK